MICKHFGTYSVSKQREQNETKAKTLIKTKTKTKGMKGNETKI